MGFPSINQHEVATYYEYLIDIKHVESCYRKKEMTRIEVQNGKIEKKAKKCFEESNEVEHLTHILRGRVGGINLMHNRMQEGGSLAPLALNFYNTHLKVIKAWNESFPNMRILVPFPDEVEIVYEKTEDRKALDRYFELLNTYPKLKREDIWNDHRKGTYQILYDPQEIQDVQKRTFEFWLKKLKGQGVEEGKALELAKQWTRPGVVFEDGYFLMIRDAVVSPSGTPHTYDRMILKADLEQDRDPGAAVLPIVTVNHEKKIALLLAYRHATNSWEWEIPRGGSKPGETSIATAQRELKEETGYVGEVTFMGAMTPDSGILASKVPIFMGWVDSNESPQYDLTEAIKGVRLFSSEEVKKGLVDGYIQADIGENEVRVPLRDSFTAYALSLAHLRIADWD